jgi:hypothetical protein
MSLLQRFHAYQFLKNYRLGASASYLKKTSSSVYTDMASFRKIEDDLMVRQDSFVGRV